MTYQEAIDKAAKLLRKGNNSAVSQEESALFLAKAQAIIDEYRLDVSDLNYDANQKADDAEPVKDFGYADPLDNVKYGQYRESWTVRLASVVSHYNQTVIRYMRTGDKGTIIRVIGRPSDVAATRYLYGFFRNQIEALQKQHCVGSSSTFKGEFAVGCIDTLNRRMKEQQRATVEEVKARHTGNSMALVRIDSAVARIEKRREDVDDFMNAPAYASIVLHLGVTRDVAKLLHNAKLAAVKAIVGDEQFEKLWKQYEKYRRQMMKGVRYGRGFSGVGSRTSTGGREAGRKAGESIRMTGAKGSIGSGQRQVGA